MTYWQVFNARGRMYLAAGETTEEAIDNARPLFASNLLYVGPGLPIMPNPEYAQVGMIAVELDVEPRWTWNASSARLEDTGAADRGGQPECDRTAG